MRVEPAHLICGTSTERVTKHGLVWVKNGELLEEFLRFPQGVRLFQYNVPTNGSRHGCNEFDNRLMGDTHRVFSNAASEDIGCDLLLLRKSAVETVYQNVRVNESGHECTDPLCSSPCFENAVSGVLSHAGVTAQLLDRINGASILYLRQRSVRWEE